MDIRNKWEYIIIIVLLTISLLYGHQLVPLVSKDTNFYFVLGVIYPIIFIVIGIISGLHGTSMASVGIMDVVYGILIFIYFRDFGAISMFVSFTTIGYFIGLLPGRQRYIRKNKNRHYI